MNTAVMLSRIVRRVPQHLTCYYTGQHRHYSKLWEPDYLEKAKLLPPEYEAVNVQMKGYDFVVLENYQRLISKVASTLDLEMEDGWAVPAKDILVHKYKKNSSVIECDFKLKLYERNLQFVDVKSNILPLLIDVLVTACPEGVTVSVHEHTTEHGELRYVPDLELKKLKQELHDMGGPIKKK